MLAVAPGFWWAKTGIAPLILPLTSDEASGGGYITRDNRGQPWQLWGAAPRVDTTVTLFGNATLNLSGGSYWCDNYAAGNSNYPDYDDFYFRNEALDFTTEFHYQPSTVTGSRYLMVYGNGVDTDTGRGWIFYTSGSTIYYQWSDSTHAGHSASFGTVGTGTMYHIAASRVGNTIHLALDGTEGATLDVTGLTQNYPSGARLTMLGQHSGTNFSRGYFGQCRWWKGTGAYSGNFTKPSAPF